MTTTRDFCLAPGRPVDAPVTPLPGRYARMLPDLPGLGCDDEELLALGLAAAVPDDEMADGEEAAGWPVFGQLVAHDITADRFLAGHDVPRNAEGTALLGDPRNDVHLLIAQLHVILIRAHNRYVDRLRGEGVPEPERFAAARRETTWRYQWILVHDDLRRLVVGELVDEILREGPRWYRPGSESYIPLRIDWALMFDVPDRPPAHRATRIDGRLPRALVELPAAITGDVEREGHRSLAGRDLQRGAGLGLPSGEAVARAFGERPLGRDELGLAAAHGWTAETPLWLYVLTEADARGGGDRLGPVGGRIVAEVLIGIVCNDPEPFLASGSGWRPAAESERYGMAELLGEIEGDG